MIKKLALLIPTCMLLAAVAFAAGGGASDPLVSLSYLLGTFTREVEEQVELRLDQAESGQTGATESGGIKTADTWAETRLKQGDSLLGTPGTGALLLAGSGRIVYEQGTVIDVTAGAEVPSGSAMTVNHRYMAAEDTVARFQITSKTAVLDYQGPYSFELSDGVDYNAMASALKQLNLFRGSFTGYGEGFDLELGPTRLQALIMFIRVLGEEEAALAWTGETPFTDLTKGSQAEQYVGYAYERGYTNGYSATQFKPGNAVNAAQYVEFVLRAMGYSSSANTDLSNTLERAELSGVLTSGEVEALRADRFLRADLVYVSYYALEADLPDGEQTLAGMLMDKGVFTLRELRGAAELVESDRM